MLEFVRSIYLKNIRAKFQKDLKYFPSYGANKLDHADGQTDRQANKQTH